MAVTAETATTCHVRTTYNWNRKQLQNV